MSDALANLGESDVIKRLQSQADSSALQLKELAGQVANDTRSTASGSSLASTLGSKRARTAGPERHGGTATPESNPCKVWIGGFPRPVLAKVMIAFADAIKKQGL
eukprot:5962954-Pyramimonas_sp.AAC.1